LDYILPSKLAIAQQEVLVGVSKALKKNKQANNGIELVILNVIFNAHKESSMRIVTKTLGSKFFKVYR
jgi:hypothetical protein